MRQLRARARVFTHGRKTVQPHRFLAHAQRRIFLATVPSQYVM